MERKLSVLFLCAAFAVQCAKAQVLTVNGNVKDNEGNTVPLALVQDKGDKTAARTDSLGRFSLKANPNSTLLVSSDGFQPKVIDIKGNTDLLIILKREDLSVSESGSGVAPNTPSTFNDYTGYKGTSSSLLYGSATGGAAMLPVFKYTEATRGSRYLFNDWVPGFVVSPVDSVYKNPNYGFNYDKMSGGLLLTQDKHSAIEIDNDRIKSFTLYNKSDQPQVYEYVADIDKKHYPQVLEKGSKYKIYKLTTTKFVKNNYHSDGMTSSGNDYDEYVDESAYYVYNVQTKQLQSLSLKKKSIKAVFASEGNKADTFLATYSGSIDDTCLKSLGDYMNQ